jgi:hypothetical protein
LLALADGTIFHGQSIGAPVESTGEIVFNTSMSGYQEILTDPSYAAQIVTLTCPHIGNVGVNPEDVESTRVFAAALVIRDLSMVASNFRSTQSLTGYLERALDGGSYVVTYAGRARRDPEPTLVSTGHVFVMSDNRGAGDDSALFAQLPLDAVVGRPRYVWASVSADGEARGSRVGVEVE